MAVLWKQSGEAYYATVSTVTGEVRFHLVVEKFGEDLWDWTVWHPDADAEMAKCGVVATAQEAMRAAEIAAGAN